MEKKIQTLSRRQGKQEREKLKKQLAKLNAVFGVDLHELAERDGKAIPSIVTHSIAHIEAKGLKQEGIFRVSGIQREVDALRERYDNGEEVNLKDKDVHTVTSLLKLYFRELPEPLLTFSLYQHCLAISKHYTNEKKKPLYYRVLVHSLPIYNRLVLLKLLAFLYTCSLDEEVNQMSADNLALVFSVNILRPLICNEKVLFAESTKINKAVSEFISFAVQLSERNGEEMDLFEKVGLINGDVTVDKENGEKVKLEKGDIVFLYESSANPLQKVEHDGEVLMVPNDSIHQHINTTPAHKPLSKPAAKPSVAAKQPSRTKKKENSRGPRRAQLPKGIGKGKDIAISTPTAVPVDQARHSSSRPTIQVQGSWTHTSGATLAPPPGVMPSRGSNTNLMEKQPLAQSQRSPPRGEPVVEKTSQAPPAKKGPPPRPSVLPPKKEVVEEEEVQEEVSEESAEDQQIGGPPQAQEGEGMWVGDAGLCLCEYVYELEAQMSGCLEEFDRANRQYLLTLEDVRQARFEMNQLLSQLSQITKNYTLTPIDENSTPVITPTAPDTPVTPVFLPPAPVSRNSGGALPPSSPRTKKGRSGGSFSRKGGSFRAPPQSPRKGSGLSPLTSDSFWEAPPAEKETSESTSSPSTSTLTPPDTTDNTPVIPPKPTSSSGGSTPRTPRGGRPPMTPTKPLPAQPTGSPRKPPPPGRPSAAPPSLG